MTALQKFIEQITPLIDRSKISDTMLHNLVEEHLEMEKEQIIQALKDSWNLAKHSNFDNPHAEQYYNQKYKQDYNDTKGKSKSII